MEPESELLLEHTDELGVNRDRVAESACAVASTQISFPPNPFLYFPSHLHKSNSFHDTEIGLIRRESECAGPLGEPCVIQGSVLPALELRVGASQYKKRASLLPLWLMT
jgi:hypothetical protein